MKALLIIDMQADFMPGGSLPTATAFDLVPLINQLMGLFSVVIASKDWHPKGHASFASSHKGKRVGEVIEIQGHSQVLWPDHCIQGTKGAEFVHGLQLEKINHTISKGTDPSIDSYSAFFDNARLKETGLDPLLKKEGIDQLFIVGVATDYCILHTVMDALDLGYRVSVILDGCRGIDLSSGDVKQAFNQMKKRGATLLLSEELRGL